MSNVSQGIDLLVAAAQDYSAARAGDDIARLEGLNLFVAMREVQAMAVGAQAMTVMEVTAAARPGQGGITITCVGYAGDMESAVKDAVGQWCLGVLPVLAHWRGEPSPLCASRELKTRSGLFDLLVGPTVVRGIAGESEIQSEREVRLVESLIPLEEAARPALRAHWIEMYACKFADGSTDATCRFDNHDFLSARKALLDVANAWPPVSEPMRSSRQFAMLAPRNMPAQEIVLPSFWDRLLGRA